MTGRWWRGLVGTLTGAGRAWPPADPDLLAGRIAELEAEADRLQTQLLEACQEVRNAELEADTLRDQLAARTAPWTPSASEAAKLRADAERLEVENDALRAEVAVLRARAMLGGREELLRERETRQRLARRLDDITAGRVTM